MEQTTNLEVLTCPKCGRAYPGEKEGALCPTDEWGLLTPELARSTTDPLMGRPLGGGRFIIVGRVGRGGFGAVYRAIQTAIGREVALKVIRPPEEDIADVEARFVQEAKSIGALEHAATVTLHDYGVEKDGLLYMALELVRGDTLQRVLRHGGALEEARAVAIARQVLESLAEAHAGGLVHRDIKPANVMLVRDHLGRERVKVLDFGIAKVLRGESDQLDAIETAGNHVIGSPRYMAPEQIRKKWTLGPFTDVYAVGLVLYEMLKGKPPFTEGSGFELMQAQVKRSVPPLPESLGLSVEVEQVVMRALRKQPAERFADAREMLAALEPSLQVTAPPAAVLPLAPDPHDPEGSTSRIMQGESVSRRLAPSKAPWLLGLVALAGLGVLGFALTRPTDPPKKGVITPAAAPPQVVDAAPKPPADAAPPDAAPKPVDAAVPDAAVPDAAPPADAAPKPKPKLKPKPSGRKHRGGTKTKKPPKKPATPPVKEEAKPIEVPIW